MAVRCPSCNSRLAEFAINCDACNWSVSTAESSANATAADNSVADSSSRGKSKNNGTAQHNGRADKQVDQTARPQKKSVNQRSDSIAEAHLNKAMERIENEHWEKAIRSINRAIVAAPLGRIGECYSLRAYCHLKLDDFERSEKDCSEAIRLNWSDSQTFAWRAAARGEQDKWRLAFADLDRAWRMSEESRDRFSVLMDSYAQACENWFGEQKRGPDALSEMGWVYFRRNHYKDAELCFREAIDKQPGHPMASAGLARLIFEGRSAAGRYTSRQTGEVLDLCNTAAIADEECQKIAVPIRARIYRDKGDLERALEDLVLLRGLAQDDMELTVKCCRLRIDAGDYMVAIDELSRIMQADPVPPEALMLRGDCYREIRNFALAKVDYSRFIERRPRSPDGFTRRADIWVSMGELDHAADDVADAIALDEACFDAYICSSRIALQKGKLDEAMTACRKASLIDNSKTEVFATLASIYFKLGQYTESIEEYSRSIELEEDSKQKANMLYLRGIAFYELGKFQQAYADLKKACHLRPNHAGSWIWKSAACARLEKWTDAIAGLQHAIATRPTSREEYRKLGRPVAEKAIEFFDRQQQREQVSADLFRRRALAFQFLGKFREAAEDYSNALKMDPGNVETLIRRGQTWASLEQTEKAVKDFKSAISRDRGNDQALYHLARTRFFAGEFKLAKRDIQRAIDSSPRNVQYHSLYADVLQRLGDHNGVVQALDRATLLDSTDPSIYRQRGQVYFLRKDYVHAVSDFTRSLELNPAQPDVLLNRAQAYSRANQLTEAIEDYERVLTQNPNCAKAWSGRAAALVLRGQHEYALIWLTKAFHRFKTARDLSEVVFARGKIFYQMGRPAPAIDDFSTVAKLMSEDAVTVAAARYARGLARFASGKLEKAVRDFNHVLKADPNHEGSRQAIAWIANPQDSVQPTFLDDSKEVIRPTRPPVIRSAVQITTRTKDWAAERPYSQWILRTLDKKEYGPLSRETLNLWIEEGRLDFGMKLLRADWSKWKRVEKIFPELQSNSGVSRPPQKVPLAPNVEQ